MKLYYSSASPYARKVLLALRHLGLIDRVEIVAATLSPVADDPKVSASNPLGKIPTLVLADGSALYDSRVIVEYLESLSDREPLLPSATNPERWTALRLQALADGLLDAALLVRYETFLRPESLRWDDWTAGQQTKMERALDQMESEAVEIDQGAPLAAICVASALGYLDFRFAAFDWRTGRRALAAFFEQYSQRQDMIETDPARG